MVQFAGLRCTARSWDYLDLASSGALLGMSQILRPSLHSLPRHPRQPQLRVHPYWKMQAKPCLPWGCSKIESPSCLCCAEGFGGL